jgi:hypothetical protein
MVTALMIAAAGLTACGASAQSSSMQAAARRAKTTGARHSSVTLQWVGDIAMSSQLGLPPGGIEAALHPVARLLRGAEVTTGNLEGTLSVGGESKCGARVTGNECYAFQAPPSEAFGLRNLGFKLVNQANNHSMDFGASGRAQTVAAVHAAGLVETGYPGQITYLTSRGIRIAFMGFAPYDYDSNLLDLPTMGAMVRTARKHAAIVVVIIHAGAEGADQTHTPVGEQYFDGEDRGDARGFAHAAIDAGATIVLGSGPHVIRGVEDYRGHLIAYSLGNFVGYHTLGGGGVLNDSAIIRVRLSATGGLLATDWIPITLDDGLPLPDPTDASAHLMASLSAEDFPSDHFRIASGGQFKLG